MKLLEELYSRKNNLNSVFDVIQEMFKSEKGNKTLSQHYANFNKVYGELKSVISHLLGCEEDAEEWDQIMVLTFLRSMPSKHTLAYPNVIRSSAFDSLQEIDFSKVFIEE